MHIFLSLKLSEKPSKQPKKTHLMYEVYSGIRLQLYTVLCKRNESEFRWITLIVLAKFPQNVSKISSIIWRRSAWYFNDNVVKICEVFRNFEEANFQSLRWKFCRIKLSFFQNIERTNFWNSELLTKRRTFTRLLAEYFA